MVRLHELVRLLTDGGNDIEEAVDRLSALRRNLGIRSLEEQGVHVQQFAHIVSQSRGGSMRSNPIELTDDELVNILQSSHGI